jgi:RNA polymerase sigma-70 factor (ECF subfamily)
MADFGRELEKTIPRLRQYALALTRDKSRADDLVQSCLAAGFEKRHQWRPGSNLRAWLFTIMHNLFVTEVRRATACPVAINESALTERRLTVAAAQHGPLQLRDLDRALGRLPTEHRIIVLLVGLQDMSYQDVAELLQVPIGTVKSRLSRAREMLRILMEGGTVAAAGRKAA